MENGAGCRRAVQFVADAVLALPLLTRREWGGEVRTVASADPASTGDTANTNHPNRREMTMNQDLYQAAIAAFDQANAEDPNKELVEGKEYPKELLYAQRMTEMQQRFAPEAPEAVKLACRAQHIRRWKIPRSDYPMDKPGYMLWRTTLYKFHAETAGLLMQEAGYDDEMIARVKTIVSKKELKSDPGTQLMEDVVGLVFIEHYMLVFAGQHPDYDEAKWIGIIQKTWNKMSGRAREFALAGKIRLPEALVPLILKAVQ